MSSEINPIQEWLKGFSQAVRARDYELGRRFFADEVVGFGSVAERCDGLENLELSQWRKVWDVTTDFEFDLNSAVAKLEGNMAWVACSWQSYGKNAAAEPILRRGRSTFVFRKDGEKWLAVHSHFSLEPKA
jgi:ketosteroid isomerase-like protein